MHKPPVGVRTLAIASVLALALAACGGDDEAVSPVVTDATSVAGVSVGEAWSREPAVGQPTAAVYAVVSNPTDQDITLVSASSPVTGLVELHETVANDDGTMQMRQVGGGFVVPAGGEFVFESGGPHIMLFDIDAASYPTDHVEVTLKFDNADSLTFTAEVRALDGGDPDGGDHDHDDATTTTTTDTGSTDHDATTTTTTDNDATTTTTDHDATTTTTTDPDDGVVRVAVAVSAGRATTTDERAEVPLGATVELTVIADEADEVHVHGYDLHGDVTPASPSVITFTADIPGVFEVELEEAGLLIVELKVS